ncbi:MAG: UV DNA damage repair endonuclease UvsE [Cystobacter sp.]
MREGTSTYRLGYVAQCLSLGVGAGHTCRLASATPERLTALIEQNLADLEQILLFNETHDIALYRIGSSLIPFASHPVNALPWWRSHARDFDRLARIARRSGQRLSLHPSPAAASLASVHQRVREASLAELRYAARVLDLLGQGPESRVVIHLGGAAPSRPEALDTAHRLLDSMEPELRDRLVLEHDDKVWTARETLALVREHAQRHRALRAGDVIGARGPDRPRGLPRRGGGPGRTGRPHARGEGEGPRAIRAAPLGARGVPVPQPMKSPIALDSGAERDRGTVT